MAKKLMWVELPDDAHLSSSRKTPGAYSPLTRDSEDRLGHVTLSDAEENEYKPPSGWPSDPDPHSERDAEEFDQRVEAVVAVLTVLGVWAAPHVRQWWSDSAMPAIKTSGSKVKATLLRAPGLRRIKNENDVPVPQGPRSGVERSEIETTGPEMSSAEAQHRFASAVLAAAYANEQMRILRNARIGDDDDPLELASKMRELTPERLQSAINLLLQADPTMLDHDKLAALEQTLERELAPINLVRELPGPTS